MYVFMAPLSSSDYRVQGPVRQPHFRETIRVKGKRGVEGNTRVTVNAHWYKSAYISEPVPVRIRQQATGDFPVLAHPLWRGCALLISGHPAIQTSKHINNSNNFRTLMTGNHDLRLWVILLSLRTSMFKFHVKISVHYKKYKNVLLFLFGMNILLYLAIIDKVGELVSFSPILFPILVSNGCLILDYKVTSNFQYQL